MSYEFKVPERHLNVSFAVSVCIKAGKDCPLPKMTGAPAGGLGAAAAVVCPMCGNGFVLNNNGTVSVTPVTVQ